MSDERELFDRLLKENEELKRRNESLACQNNEREQQIDGLREQINDLLRRLYGRKSERFENPNQLDLLKLLGCSEEGKASAEQKPEEKERIEYTRKKPQKFGPKPLPEHLPRIVVPVDPPEEECVCGFCCKGMERVDETITEELDVVPQHFRVKRYVQGKYRCRQCMNRDLVKALPPRPISKGRPSPSLLAYLVISKYVDHIPLHRQEQMFARQGVSLRRSTMNEWFGSLSELLLPIVEAMKRRLVKSRYLQIDETPIQALDRGLKGKTRRCYLWSYCRPADEIVYDVTKSRAGRYPRDFLAGFSGCAQTDGYSGYNELFSQQDVEHVACMAHIRRKFFEAKHALPERVEEILSLIGELYDVEREARDSKLSKAERKTLRGEKSVAVFTELKERIDALAPLPTPSSKLGKACRYALGQWPSMARYLEIPEAEIDNNACERSIRPAVIGRKNFLFLGSAEAGGLRAEVFYSLSQSAKALGLNPFEYLRDVIERVATTPDHRIDELTPRSWSNAQQTAEKLTTSPVG